MQEWLYNELIKTIFDKLRRNECPRILMGNTLFVVREDKTKMSGKKYLVKVCKYDKMTKQETIKRNFTRYNFKDMIYLMTDTFNNMR